MGKLVKYGAFALLFFFVFFIGLILTLPGSVLNSVVEAQAEKALDFKYDVEVGSTRITGPASVRLTDVTLTSTREPIPGDVIMPTHFDRVKLRVNLLSTVRGQVAVRAQLETGDGRMVIRYGGSDIEDAATAIRIEFEELPLQNLGLMSDYIGMSAQGNLTGVFELRYDDENRLNGGEIDMNVPAMSLAPGQIRGRAFDQVGGALILPTATSLGSFTLKAGIERSLLRFEQFDTTGPDLQLSVTGEVGLRDPLRASRMATRMLIALDPGWVERAELGSILAQIQLLRQSQTPAGYSIALNGQLGNLQPAPAPGAR